MPPKQDTKDSDKESVIDELEEIDDIDSDNISIQSDDNDELVELDNIPNIDGDTNCVYSKDNMYEKNDDIEDNIIHEQIILPEKRIATKFLTNYERVRLLGARTAQLSQGAKPMINGVKGMNPKIIAQLELECKMIPIKILRTLPNNTQEVWSLNELKLKSNYIIYGFTGHNHNVIPKKN